jgi:hypothetical protein
MRAPMHSNYLNTFARIAAALPLRTIPSSRPGVTACAFDGERHQGGLS